MDVLKIVTIPELLGRSLLWAIHPSFLLRCLRNPGVLAFTQDWQAAKPSITGKGENKIAIIPVQGVLTSDGPSWYGTNYETITDAAEKAASDSSIKKIILSVDSPGGEVTGLPETAAVLGQVSQMKPMSAVVEGLSASAAYWLTTQARDVTITPSGEVGSVGVRMMHMDISKMLEDYGVKVTELFSGNHKTEWSPYKPLAQETIDHETKRLASMHQDFINAVSAGRPRASAEMKDTRFGEGRTFPAKDALAHGLVDKIQSPRDFYRAMMPAQEQAPDFGLRRAGLEVAKSRF
jgi:capsid assembly protease